MQFLKETTLDKNLKRLDFGQFFFLYLLGRNVDYTTFKTILKELEFPQRTSVRIDENEGIELKATPTAPRGSIDGLPGYPETENVDMSPDPYPYPCVEPGQKDTGEEEVNNLKVDKKL